MIKDIHYIQYGLKKLDSFFSNFASAHEPVFYISKSSETYQE